MLDRSNQCEDNYIADKWTDDYRLKKKNDGTLVLERKLESVRILGGFIKCDLSREYTWHEIQTVSEDVGTNGTEREPTPYDTNTLDTTIKPDIENEFEGDEDYE